VERALGFFAAVPIAYLVMVVATQAPLLVDAAPPAVWWCEHQDRPHRTGPDEEGPPTPSPFVLFRANLDGAIIHPWPRVSVARDPRL
jgi:hypothetical protein